jgi:hypothetical protein
LYISELSCTPNLHFLQDSPSLLNPPPTSLFSHSPNRVHHILLVRYKGCLSISTLQFSLIFHAHSFYLFSLSFHILYILLSLMYVSRPNRTPKISLSTTINMFFFQYHCTFFRIPYISCYHSPAYPSKKMLTLFFKFLLQHPRPTARFILFCLSHFFKLCPDFPHSKFSASHQHCPSSSTTTSITICAIMNSVRGCSVLFKFW